MLINVEHSESFAVAHKIYIQQYIFNFVLLEDIIKEIYQEVYKLSIQIF